MPDGFQQTHWPMMFVSSVSTGACQGHDLTLAGQVKDVVGRGASKFLHGRWSRRSA